MNTLALPRRTSAIGSTTLAASRVSDSPRSNLQQTNPLEGRAEEKIKNRIKLLLVDDHPVVRRGISSWLSCQEGFAILGEAADGLEAVRKVSELLPDIVLMDIYMPHMDGLAVTELLRRRLPNIKVLVLSTHSNTDFVLRIIQSGARGYVLKEASPQELVRAIEAVDSGKTFFSPDVANLALNQFVLGSGDGRNPAQMSNRERQVLIHLAQGLSNKEIASALNIGVRTVEAHRERLMSKLDIHSVAGLTKYAISKGLVILNE